MSAVWAASGFAESLAADAFIRRSLLLIQGRDNRHRSRACATALQLDRRAVRWPTILHPREVRIPYVEHDSSDERCCDSRGEDVSSLG